MVPNANVSGTNTITNSPISTSVNGHISSYLSDLSNCSNSKTHSIDTQKIAHFCSHNCDNHHGIHIHNPYNSQNEINHSRQPIKSIHVLNNHDNCELSISPNVLKDENNEEFYDSSDSDDFDDECDELSEKLNQSEKNNSKYVQNKAKIKKTNSSLLKDLSDSLSDPLKKKSEASLNNKMNDSVTQENLAFCAKLNKSMSKYAHDPDFPCLNFKNSDQSLKLEVT